MTVYVDDMKAAYEPPHATNRQYVMSHMIADTERELHEMARKIGVARKWYQGDHYDITQSKKAEALKLGAVQITWRQCGTMTMNRRAGFPMGTPETCEQIALERRNSSRFARNFPVQGANADDNATRIARFMRAPSARDKR